MEAKPFNIDFDRERRLGFPEVVYGLGKSADLLSEILRAHLEAGHPALVTRVESGKAAALLRVFPEAQYDSVSGCFLLGRGPEPDGRARVAILSAGSSDLGVVNEALFTLRFLGESAAVVGDIGVAGIHRLLGRLDELREFQVLVVVAGFEGALPSVVGGLLPQPIIAVPASTGYGAGGDGTTALHAMLASCANGVMVMNIDNGYGAAVAAYRILRQGG